MLILSPGLIPDNEQNKEALLIAVRENKSINPLARDVYSPIDANLLNPSTRLRDLREKLALSLLKLCEGSHLRLSGLPGF